MNEMTGKWLGWIGIVIAIIGIFYSPIWMGSLAIILGLLCLATPKKGLAWWSIGIGLIAIIISYF